MFFRKSFVAFELQFIFDCSMQDNTLNPKHKQMGKYGIQSKQINVTP